MSSRVTHIEGIEKPNRSKPMSSKSQALAEIIKKAGINATNVKLLGSIAHIDSFDKYHDKLVDLMTTAGFKVLHVSNGFHMDGSKGYRASFMVAA
jgi:hypothetical protein